MAIKVQDANEYIKKYINTKFDHVLVCSDNIEHIIRVSENLTGILAANGALMDTKGDILGFTTETVRVPVGIDNYVLTADSTDPIGFAWKVAAGGGGVALGETSATAYRGDRGKIAYDHSLLTTNPHGTTKAHVGLALADNTADTAKPVSTAQQTALDLKEDAIIKQTGFNLIVGVLAGQVAEGNHTHIYTSTDVGLGAVDNTADVSKPVSTAQQTALDLKADATQVLTNVPAGALFTDTTYTVADGQLSQINFTSADNTKLDGIADGAQVNALALTNANIKTQYELNADTNVFDDAAQSKLSGVVAGANNYSHPVGDGNLHVPANSTTNNGKVLTASGTTGVYTWETPTSGGASTLDGLTDVDLTVAPTDTQVLAFDNASGTFKAADAATGGGGVTIGVLSTEAHRGDYGLLNDNHRAAVTGNPHAVNKTDVGLANVDNTADTAKPVSTAQQTALDGKIDDAQVLTNVPAGALFTDTTYTVADGQLSQINFTTADNTKLDGITALADVSPTPLTNGQIKTQYELNGDTNAHTDAQVAKLAAIDASANNYVHPTTDGNSHVLADGGTNTGKVLTASGVAGVYTWETPSGGGGGLNTTKGDLEGFSTVAARIPVGTNDQILTADSSAALGVAWKTAAGGGNMSLPTVDNTSDLGTATIAYRDVFAHRYLLDGDGDGVFGINTADGADNRRIRITAGSLDTFSNARGASIDLHGNEHANVGALDLVGGGAAGTVSWWTNNLFRGEMLANGNLSLENQIVIKGGTPAAGQVLTSVDATGIATWEPAPVDHTHANQGVLDATTASFLTADETKLDAIEALATADQTGAEIKTAYEAQANAFTDAKNTKLTGIETAATADQTGAEIKTAYQAEANAYTDALNTKLGGIETSATADQTGAEIKTAYQAEANAYTDTKNTKLAGIATGADVSPTALTDAQIKTQYELNANTNEFSDAEQTKLGGVATSANLYVHPTGDGNLHVPANSTSNNGKVLTASSTAGVYTWETPSGGGSNLTTKGDLEVYTTTPTRLAVGTNGQVLEADSAAASGVKWATPAAGGGIVDGAGGAGTITSIEIVTTAGSTAGVLYIVIPV